MYNEFMNKSNLSILEYMEKLGKDSRLYGVLLTSDLVSDNRATNQLRELLDIGLIYGVKGLGNISIPVNTDKEHPLAFPMMFLYEAEFSESDILYASHHLHSLEEEEEPIKNETVF